MSDNSKYSVSFFTPATGVPDQSGSLLLSESGNAATAVSSLGAAYIDRDLLASVSDSLEDYGERRQLFLRICQGLVILFATAGEITIRSQERRPVAMSSVSRRKLPQFHFGPAVTHIPPLRYRDAYRVFPLPVEADLPKLDRVIEDLAKRNIIRLEKH